MYFAAAAAVVIAMCLETAIKTSFIIKTDRENIACLNAFKIRRHTSTTFRQNAIIFVFREN